MPVQQTNAIMRLRDDKNRQEQFEGDRREWFFQRGRRVRYTTRPEVGTCLNSLTRSKNQNCHSIEPMCTDWQAWPMVFGCQSKQSTRVRGNARRKVGPSILFTLTMVCDREVTDRGATLLVDFNTDVLRMKPMHFESRGVRLFTGMAWKTRYRRQCPMNDWGCWPSHWVISRRRGSASIRRALLT